MPADILASTIPSDLTFRAGIDCEETVSDRGRKALFWLNGSLRQFEVALQKSCQVNPPIYRICAGQAMRISSVFISQSPSDDEHFPYWTPSDYLKRKFDLDNAYISQFLSARVSVPGYSRHPSVRDLLFGRVSLVTTSARAVSSAGK
jgi:hypothetical protein